MNAASSFMIEFVGRILLVGVFWFSLRFGWWVPMVSAVLFWQIWNMISPRSGYYFDTTSTDLFKMIADFITFGIYAGYVVYSVIVFGRHIGSWYGWVIGLVLSLLIVQILGLLWPARWHDEGVQGRL